MAACVGLPLLLAVVLFLPPVATAILFALACGVAAYEMLWRTGILKHRRILVYTVVAAMANVMWSWLRACSIVSEQTLWLCALLGLFVYFCALFCELLAAHTELRFTAVCVALFSGFVYPFLIGALVRLARHGRRQVLYSGGLPAVHGRRQRRLFCRPRLRQT